MRAKLFAAGVLAAAAMSAQAQDIAGHVDLSYGEDYWESGGFESDYDRVTLSGSVVIPVSDGWLAQGDGWRQWVQDEFGNDFEHGGVTLTVAHRGERHALGGFVGLLEYYDRELVTYGAEGQAYLENVTLSGYFGFLNADDSDWQVDGWWVGVAASYYLRPNLALQGALSYGNSELDEPIDWTESKGWQLRAGAEYQIEGTPVSVFAQYVGERLDFRNNVIIAGRDNDSDGFRVGLRVALGTDDLVQRDRSGASFTASRDIGEAFVRRDD